MNSKSLFKLVIYVINWIKLSLIVLPVSAALVAMKQGKMKYGYDFLTVDHSWSLVIAVGIGMVLNTWHAMRFEETGNVDPKQYLKMRQRFMIKNSPWTPEQLRIKIEALLQRHPKRMEVRSQNPNSCELLVRNGYGFKDIVTLALKENGVEVYSRPKSPIAIIDLARNLNNCLEISKHLKEVG